MGITKWKCANFRNCPKADSREEVEIADGGLHPTCECGSALVPVGGKRSPWPALVIVAVLVVIVVVAGLILVLKKSPAPPPLSPAKTSVAIVVDGQILNPVMVRTPAWLGEWAAGFSTSNNVLSLGLWGCRPVEPNGDIRTPLRNYAPTLMPLADFKKLQIPKAPKPDQWPEALRKGNPSYDLFSDLKSVLRETRWDSPTNRFLLIITETSAFPKSSENNSARIDEQELRKLADEAHVKVFAIHVIVPSDLMADDQRLAEQQLRALCDNGGQNSYYAVQKSTMQGRGGEGEPELVTAYLDGLKTAFGQILGRVLESPKPEL
jgi:hypothetical protein